LESCLERDVVMRLDAGPDVAHQPRRARAPAWSTARCFRSNLSLLLRWLIYWSTYQEGGWP